MQDTAHFQIIESITKEVIQQEIKRFSEESNQIYLPKSVRLNFVRMAQQTLSIFSNTDEIVQNLIPLLSMSSTANIKSLRRRKRSATADTIETEEDTVNIEDHLRLLEVLVKSTNETVSKDAKLNLTKTMHSFMMKTCKWGAFPTRVFGNCLV